MADDIPPPPPAVVADGGDVVVDLEQRVRQLMMSIGQGSEDAVRELSILIESFNQEQIVDFLEIMARMYVENGTNVDMSGGQEGVTMLMVAASSGRMDFARYLLAHGATVGRCRKRLPTDVGCRIGYPTFEDLTFEDPTFEDPTFEDPTFEDLTFEDPTFADIPDI
ncbi:hypothetical protein niasHT_026643 [Heterodera trifolii]|uniref:Uncharacterized protein n=1 Tax=Heterodera trifolii TaxID=157864 RepID=A0ABD2KSK4_9BILA